MQHQIFIISVHKAHWTPYDASVVNPSRPANTYKVNTK